jgi:DNA-directed RNA polymerase II subunit RPB2
MNKVNTQSMSKKEKQYQKQFKTLEGYEKMKGGDTDYLDTEDIFKLGDLYFRQKNILYSHLHNSFNKFLDEDLISILTNGDNIFFEKITNETAIKYKFKYTNISIKAPYMDTTDEIMFPYHARMKNLTYGSKVVATVTQIQEIIDIVTDKKTSRVIGEPEHNVDIAIIPIMVRSKYCNLELRRGQENTEGTYDPGGYFIVNGSEKVVMSLERMIDNKPLVFIKKDSSTIYHNVQVNSKSPQITGMTQITSIKVKKDGIMTLKVPILNEVPVCILLRALGLQSDKEIMDCISYNDNDIKMQRLIRLSIDGSKKNEYDQLILTQEDAINYLISKMRIFTRYSETNKEIRDHQKKIDLLHQLTNSFLPHVNNNLIEKAYYVGYMINRLLNCVLGRNLPDDRDNYVNKRIDLPGALLGELFKQYYRKMLNECNKFFRKRNNDDVNPFNIINQIKSNIIDQGLKTALSTGAWGRKKGVAQMLQRLSYMKMISSLRRVNATNVDAVSNKLTSPRHLHGSQVSYICIVETPEGIKVGLVKNLSVIGNITLEIKSQVGIIKNFLVDKIKNIRDVPLNRFNNYIKVFLNGEWIGLTSDGYELYIKLKKSKLDGTFDPHTGIIYDIENREIKIYCDGGRLFKPSLVVENNLIKLNKKHIDTIDTKNKQNITKISTWNEFLVINPGLIEYVDAEESSYLMLAIHPDVAYAEKQKMEQSIVLSSKLKPDELEKVINRYDDLQFVRYTHSDLHPCFMLGVVASNIPFLNCNQGPRNIYQYSQATQAISMYATNYKHRFDISYMLYHPQRPIVMTRMMKYINTDNMPFGENVVVALMCYTGYNQEDSVIVNQSAIDRGLFRSTSFKKKLSLIQKNQTTSQDDVFIKPDPKKVEGMRYGSYDKLNEQGYVPKETKITNGDIILAKVSPIQPVGNSLKTFKDNSESYKSHIDGTVDDVYTNILNHEGYEMRRMRIRSERIPHIGDKVCSRAAQKGTIGITLSHSDMPFTKEGITPDLIVNPNAIPSRMTMGQFIECLTGKLGAIKGVNVDGTGFEAINLEKVKKELEDRGFEPNGNEYLYNGMTGKKMKVMIFIGPTYYLRLKHMVSDKIHSRSRGPRTQLTHQPLEGRARDGGLRFGNHFAEKWYCKILLVRV